MIRRKFPSLCKDSTMAHDTLPERIDNHCLQLSQIIGAILLGTLLSVIIVWHGLT
jgi:hypothetical protein